MLFNKLLRALSDLHFQNESVLLKMKKTSFEFISREINGEKFNKFLKELKLSGNQYYHYLFRLISYYKSFLQEQNPKLVAIDINELFENSAVVEEKETPERQRKIQKLRAEKRKA